MKKKVSLLLLVIAVFALVSTITYAYWNLSFEQSQDNVVVTDCFKITYEEDTNSNIQLERGYPIRDEEGKNLTPYVFWMENICTSMANYQINMESMANSTMPERVLKAKLNDDEGVLLRTETTPTIGVKAFKVEEGYLHAGEKKRYEVRLWMDESTTMDDTDAMNKLYVGKVTVIATYNKNGITYTEDILNGTDPVLKDGLIPVTIDYDGTVKKADITSVWYQYSEQKWANAIILLPENERLPENKGKVYEDWEEIPEGDIESYFVWIPRYKYKIWDMGKYETLTTVDYNQVHVIDVVFGTDTTKDTEYECTTPNQSGADGTCSIGKYMTHPAFTSFDTENNVTKGMWVGKFETGYKDATSALNAQQNPNGGASDKVQIKPDVYSWRGIQVANAHLTSYNYKRELDSHMMKNTEWGAVAYLQHSKYGSHESVRINNNSNYLTGYAAVFEPTKGMVEIDIFCKNNPSECIEYGTTSDITKRWNTEVGYQSSTSGNISGIYDMSGGAYEYVMGFVNNIHNNSPCVGLSKDYTSGFNGSLCYTSGIYNVGIDLPNKKYYDTYQHTVSDKEFSKRILGDAMGEVGPFQLHNQRYINSWYYDEGWFIWEYYPWFSRGGIYYNGNGSGIFSSLYDYGSSSHLLSFRLVLTPQEV